MLTKDKRLKIGVPPCKRHLCEHYMKCKYHLMACKAFEQYCSTGRTYNRDALPSDEFKRLHTPTKHSYKKLFSDEG